MLLSNIKRSKLTKTAIYQQVRDIYQQVVASAAAAEAALQEGE